MRSNLTADLAHVLHRLGRPDEALQMALASQAIAAHDDLFAQVRWRGAAARSLAGQGRLAEAERLAAEAVGIAAPTDMLTMHGDALLDQAVVAAAAGRPGDAARAARDALALYQAQGQPRRGGPGRGRHRRHRPSCGSQTGVEMVRASGLRTVEELSKEALGVHRRAKLTVLGRRLLIQRIIAEGWPVARACRSPGRFGGHGLQIWLGRWRTEGTAWPG
jgi:hypothetical protein